MQAEFGGEADWTGGLLDKSLDYFDALTEHWYARGGKRFDLELHKDDILFKGDNAGYVPVEEPLEDWARRPVEPRAREGGSLARIREAISSDGGQENIPVDR